MFNELPVDIVRTVIEGYLHLDIQQLSCLDVAFCNHDQRPDLLHILRSVKTDVVLTNAFTDESTLICCLEWVASRGMTIPRLDVELSAFASGPFPFSRPLPVVNSIYIIHNKTFQVNAATMQGLKAFLNQFQSLQVLGLWETMEVTQVQWLLNLSCAIHGLDMLTCKKLTSAAITQLLTKFGASLSMLKLCSGAGRKVWEDNDEPIAIILAQCNNLTVLDASRLRNVDGTHLVAMCVAIANTVEDLTIAVNWQLSITRLETITTACTKLKCIRIVIKDNILGTTLNEFVRFFASQQPQLAATIDTHRLRVQIVSDKENNKVAHIMETPEMKPRLDGKDDKEVLKKIVVDLPIPVRALQLTLVNEAVATAVLAFMSAMIGADWESLDLHLNFKFLMSPQNRLIGELLHNCPNLTSFKLDSQSVSGDFTNSPMPVLNKVTELVLPNTTAMVTASALKAVVNAFPNVNSFTMMSNAISKHLLLDLIVSKQLNAKRITLNEEIAGWIAGQLAQHGQHCKHEGIMIEQA